MCTNIHIKINNMNEKCKVNAIKFKIDCYLKRIMNLVFF